MGMSELPGGGGGGRGRWGLWGRGVGFSGGGTWEAGFVPLSHHLLNGLKKTGGEKFFRLRVQRNHSLERVGRI